MEDFNILELLLKEGEKELAQKGADTGGVKLRLSKDLYDSFTPEQWAEYLKKNNYRIVVDLVDNDAVYRVTKEGTLKKLALDSIMLGVE